MKFTGSRPDRPRRTRGIQPDFAPRGGVSLEQAGRLHELRERARLSGMAYATLLELIRRVGLSKAEDDIEGRLDELEKLIDEELEKKGGHR